MKKISTLIFALTYFINAFAQNPPIAGYKLWLDASSAGNFVAGNATTPSLWKDLSVNKNNIRTLLTFGTNPQLVTYQGYPAIKFNGDNIMQNDTLNNDFGDTSATVFIVTNSNNTQASISVATDLSVNNEMVIENSNVFHHSNPSNWIGKALQCKPTNDSSIIIVTGAWAGNPTSFGVNSYINNVKSTKPTSISGANANGQYGYPTDFLATNRRIYIGGRTKSGSVYSGHQYNGYIYEVIVYNKLLNDAEIASVNSYLKGKYALNYSICNASGIDDIEGLNFHLSPNPVQSVLNVKISASESSLKNFRIYDLAGRLVMSEPKVSDKIDVSNLCNGSYLLVIETADNFLHTKHFIKQN